jgi:hypothetical protein
LHPPRALLLPTHRGKRLPKPLNTSIIQFVLMEAEKKIITKGAEGGGGEGKTHNTFTHNYPKLSQAEENKRM